jgi:hypothetical protein
MSQFGGDPYPKAAALGKVVVLPDDHQLFIDIDTPEDHVCFETRMLDVKACGLDIVVDQTTASTTEGHLHITLRCGFVLDPVLRCALQAALGSDRKRELLSLGRIISKVPLPPTVFFENP